MKVAHDNFCNKRRYDDDDFIILRLGRVVMYQHTTILLVQLFLRYHNFFDFPDGDWPPC